MDQKMVVLKPKFYSRLKRNQYILFFIVEENIFIKYKKII